jgi:hypothetical protein
MITINTVSASKFSYNGINYFKNFTPVVFGNKISILNTYDACISLTTAPTHFSEYVVNGQTFASVALLQDALLPVIFTKNGLITTQWGDIGGSISAQSDLQNVLNAKADLVSGKVPTSQLPSYVDDVLEFANFAALPTTGETGKIYITLDTNKIYRWSGSAYIEITSGGSVWGAITGTLSNQTDLQTALNAKQNLIAHLEYSNTDLTVWNNGKGNIDTNTSFGEFALLNNTTGGSNTAIGQRALLNNTTGGSNTAIGRSVLAFNTTGGSNTAIGTYALEKNTTGGNNTAIGQSALQQNTTGYANTANGQGALQQNTTGGNNTAIGQSALENNTTGFSNTAIGRSVLAFNTTGNNNTAVGFNSGIFIANGQFSLIANNSTFLGTDTRPFADNQTNQIVIGHQAVGAGSNTVTIGNTDITTTRLRGNVQGGSFVKDGGTSSQFLMADGSVSTSAVGSLEFNATDLTVWNNGKGNIGTNTSFGSGIFKNITTGNGLTAFGIDALENVTNGNFNTAIGKNALNSTTSGSNCTSIGDNSLIWNTTGSGQTAIGQAAGSIAGTNSANQTSSNSVYVGAGTKASANGNTNEIVIGHNAIGHGSNTVTLGNSSIATTILRGNVGIGTTSPFSASGFNGLTLDGTTGSLLQLRANGTNALQITSSSINSVFYEYRNLPFVFATNGTSRMSIEANGNIYIVNLGTGTVYSNGGVLTNTNPSDERLKENIDDLEYGLAEILQLRPVSYNWINDSANQGKQFGFIAQEVQEIMPDLINEFTITEDEDEVVRLGLDKEAIFVAMVNAIKELKAEIELLKQ